MKAYKLPLLLSALLLTACGGSSDSIDTEQAPVEQPPTEQTPVDPTPVDPEPVVPAPEPGTDYAIDNSVAVPVKLKISSNSNNVTLSWGYVPGATSYNVFYSEENSVDENSQSFNTNSTSYSQQGLATAVHNYKIQAIFAEKGAASELSTRLTADLSNQVKVQD